MAFKSGENPHHPKLGSSIKVEPIRDRSAINRIKRQRADNLRDVCLFTFGINTAYRANELLSITVGQVKDRAPGHRLELKQSKTGKYRAVTLNENVIAAVDAWLQSTSLKDEDYLFMGLQGPLTVPTVSTMVKRWCMNAGLRGHYGSHTLRKTWGFWQRQRGTPIPLLMEAFGHSTQRQTLDYLCISDDEIASIYDMRL